MSINCILTGNKITEHDLADELMLPVQNGGLYINSETTEEDKAEAQANLEGLGVIIYKKGVINKGDITSGNIEDILINNNSFVAIVFDTVAGMPYDSIWVVVNTRIPGLVSVKATNIYNGDTYMKTFVNSSWREWKRVNSDYFLPLDGSVPMSGSLGIANNLGGFYADINGVLVNQYETKGDYDNRRGVWVHSKSHTDLTHALQFFTIENGADKLYNIFGEHNKPSGSYTGNGSATSREITIPALSTYDLITIQSSTEYIGLVGAWGAVFIDVTSSVAKGYSASVIKRTANGITIAGTENAFNKNGVTYYFGTI